MANNNNQLYNAALTGFLAASQTGRGVPTPLPANEVAAAQAFATKLDSLIPADAGIVTPTTSEALAKVNLLIALVEGALEGRASLSAVGADYTSLATAIAASYQQVVLLLALP